MLRGEFGEARKWAVGQQLQVGQMFDAPDTVAVTQAHIMADSESLGDVGVEFLQWLAGLPAGDRKVRIPTITDPRGLDFAQYECLKQEHSWARQEQTMIDSFRALDVLMTDTCINYQTVSAPVFGEHVAMGDTGVVIYSNSVCGARTNFEGGPAAIAAALTGRTPRYGLHLDEARMGTHLFDVRVRPKSLSDWGALGGIVGRAAASYWYVPVLAGIDLPPSSDELKHFGAALASFGSVPMFHMVGVTPNARELGDVFDGPAPAATRIKRTDIDDFYAGYGDHADGVDIVVFAAPQLSIHELQDLARLLEGRTVNPSTTLLVATSPENKSAADRFGLTQTIEASGATLLKGVCFYQMHAREMGQANGWKRLLTNSAKLVNIIGGYGYKPVLADMERCVDAAVSGVHQ